MPESLATPPTATTVSPAPRHAATGLLSCGSTVAEILDPAAPGELHYHTGVRYSPVAALLRLDVAGDEYLFNPVHRDSRRDHGGLAMEFDLVTPGGPPGFATAGHGETFLKVGVGELRKSTEEYSFGHPYELVRPAQTVVHWSAGKAHFVQTSPQVQGYQYRLEALVTVTDRQVTIDCTLRNTGSRPLSTANYVHNFFRFNGVTIGPGYVLSFPYDIAPGGLTPIQTVRGGDLSFVAPMTGPINNRVDWPVDFNGANTLSVAHAASGLHVTCLTDRPSTHTAVHLAPNYACPEQFIQLDVTPGAETAWTRAYTFEKR